MPDSRPPTAPPDLNQVAADLAKTAAALERHINTEAQKRANKLAVQYAKAADERIAANATELQRAQDLAEELFEQRKMLVRRYDQYMHLEAAIDTLAQTAREHGEHAIANALNAAVVEARNAGRATTNEKDKEP